MKAIIVLSLLGILITGTYSVCTAAASGGDQICCGATNAGTTANTPGANVLSCVNAATDGADAAAATCDPNMIYADGTFGSATLKSCSPCPQGRGNAGGTLATCAICTDGQASTGAGAGCTAASGNAVAGIALGCRVFGAANKSTCAISKNGWSPSDGTTATLNPCGNNQYSTDNGACTALTDAATTAAANCRSYSAAAGTLANCAVPKDGYVLENGAITVCGENTFSTNGAACAATAPAQGTTPVANCRVYSSAAATTCIVPKAGYYLTNSGAGTGTCATGCDECSGTAAANCDKAASGQYLSGTGANKTILDCPANCTACTPPVAPSTTPTCTAVKAGFKLASGAASACGAGQGSVEGNTATTCTTCTATQVVLRGSCTDKCVAATVGADYLTYGTKCCYASTTNSALLGVGVLTCATAPTVVGEYNAATCAAGFFINNGACERICSGTTADAAAYGDKGGMKCCNKDASTTLKGKGVSTCSAAPATFVSASEINAANCNENFYLSSGACMACAANKYSLANSTTADSCKESTAPPTGAFFDTTTNTFVRCTAPCATCSGQTTCLSCVTTAIPNFKEPTEDAENYNTLLQNYFFDNTTSTCLTQCSEGFVTDPATRSLCAADTGSSIGLFAVIFSLFSIVITLF